jgi:hypothetical protein
VVGYLINPSTYADVPKDDADHERYVASAEAIRATIGTLREQDLAEAEFKDKVPHEDDQLQGDENWGPKTTAVPEDPLPDVDVSTLVNWGPDIPEDVKPRLEEVLRKNAAAFGVGGRLGHVDTKVPIPLKPDTQPISLPMYGASPAKREVIDKQMDAWFEAEVIEPSTSPWGFPCIVVYRNGKPRLCVDYRKLNKRTVLDEFPIPRQSEILQALSSAQVLSSFDALAGFTQLEMSDDAKEKTAFRSHRGLWQFHWMPFGLRNGPSVFQRVMQGVLSPYLWLFTLVYIDDIVVFSKSWDEHLVHLDKVLRAITSAGITLSPLKCFVGYSSILLLRQKVSWLGLSTHKEKVAAIQELVRPTHISDLQKFLGMCVYFAAYTLLRVHRGPAISSFEEGSEVRMEGGTGYCVPASEGRTRWHAHARTSNSRPAVSSVHRPFRLRTGIKLTANTAGPCERLTGNLRLRPAEKRMGNGVACSALVHQLNQGRDGVGGKGRVGGDV